jgi:hypothetical protein
MPREDLSLIGQRVASVSYREVTRVTQLATKILFTAMVCGSLSACSSGGSGGSSDDPPTFSELEAEGDVLAGQIEALDYTDPSSLPTSGSAQYNGVMGVYVGDEENGGIIAGDLRLDVAFSGADPITGRVTNLVDQDNTRYQGQLNISGSDLDRTIDPDLEYTYVAGLAGSVSDPADGAVYNVNGDLFGDFFGSNYSHTGGDVEGTVCSAGDCLDMYGLFGARR